MYFKSRMASFISTTFIVTSLFAVSGCSPSQSPVSNEADVKAPGLVIEGSWQVEDIDNGGIIDSSMITMQVGEDNKIAGSTGCNRYLGQLVSANYTFKTSKVVSTRKSCAPALANQEQRFLTALSSAARYEIKSKTWLVVFDEEGNQRLKLIPMSPNTVAANIKVDDAANKRHAFNCDVMGKVQFRFVGPDTIELRTKKFTKVLHQKAKASGAYYEDGSTSFWNKGNSAMLVIEDQAYSCKSIIDEY